MIPTITQLHEKATRRLIQAVQELSLARDIERIRVIVRAAARELVDADGASFVLRDGDLCHYVDEDAIGPLWKGQRFPMSACISGWVMLHRRPAIVPDIYRDERIPVDAYRPTFVRSLVMTPIRDADPVGAIGVYWATPYRASETDVELLQALANTAAVAMENVRVYKELEQRVDERTAQLAAANEELDAFAHSVSHDLRAPLRHISGFAGLLAQDPGIEHLTTQGRHCLDRINTSASSMSRLIDDLLAFARHSRVPLDKTPVDLRALIREVQHEAIADAPERAIEWHTPQSSITVLADQRLLRHALLNLLSNAVKYTRGRSPAVIEVTVRDDEASGELVVSVRDNGAGFNPAHADRLFAVFQRLHTVEAFEGHGVGLANVRRIVHRHGGRTWAEGAVGQGATFSFSLPR